MEAQAGGVIAQLRSDMQQALLLARLHLQVRSFSTCLDASLKA